MDIGTGDSAGGARVGGRGPRSARPNNLSYLLTVPIVGDPFGRDISVFTASAHDVIPLAGVLSDRGPIVDFAIHGRDVDRAPAGGPGDSQLSAHPLLLGAVSPDVNGTDDAAPWSGHKLGGSPYIVNVGEPVEAQVAALIQSGYVHLLQVDFPGNAGDVTVTGPWPFGTGMFHVLARLDERRQEFRWFFEL